jgi:hypothetical protein
MYEDWEREDFLPYFSERAQMTAQEIETELAQETGSEEYYKHPLGLMYTQGIKSMAELCGAYWLISVIASRQTPPVRREPFQLWILTVQDTRATLECWTDTPGTSIAKRLVREEIDWTDFPLPQIKLYLANNVLHLPSEY